MTPHPQSTGEPETKIFDLYRQYLSDKDYNVVNDGKNYEQLFLSGIAALIRTEACRLAREVIGKDETLDDLDRTAEVDYLVAVMRKKRNELRAEQRTRLQSLVKEGTEK